MELNPLRARLARRAENGPWSSVRAHLAGCDDGLVPERALPGRVGAWRSYLAGGLSGEKLEALRRHTRTGRPLGAECFLDRLEALLGRTLRPRKPGRKPKTAAKTTKQRE